MQTNNILTKFYNELPQDTASKAIKSGIYSFAIATVITANPVVGFIFGAAATIASLVHSAVTPLFKQIASYSKQLSWGQHFARIILSSAVASLMVGVPQFALPLALLTIAIDILKHGLTANRPVNEAKTYIAV